MVGDDLIRGLPLGNRAMVYKLCAAIADIADIRGPVQTVTAFFFKIGACLVAGGAGSTFHTTENNFSTGIFLFAMVPMNAEVMGIIENTFMPPIRKLTGFDLFGDGSWIHAQETGNILKRGAVGQLILNISTILQ